MKNKKCLFLFSLLIFLIFLIFLDIKTATDINRYFEWIKFFEKNTFSETIKYIYKERSDGLLFFNTMLLYYLGLKFGSWLNFIAICNFLSFFALLTVYYNFLKNNIKDNNKNFFYFFPLLLVSNPDYIHWSRYVMTDFIWANLLFIFFIFLCDQKRKKILMFCLILLIIFTRPTSIVFLIIFFFLIIRKILKSKKIFFWFVFIFFNLSIFSFSFLIQNFENFDLPNGIREQLFYFQSYYDNGAIINSRPHTYSPNPDNILDIYLIILKRCIYFFKFYDLMYSNIHNLINFFTFSPIYCLFLYTVWNYKKLSQTEKKIFDISIIFILGFVLMHSMLLIDFDWRYRLPILSFILLISCIGLKYFYAGLKKQNV